jgi:hypothetical protein
MKNFRAADKSHAGGDEKRDINFHWPNDKEHVANERDENLPVPVFMSDTSRYPSVPMISCINDIYSQGGEGQGQGLKA